MCRLALPIVTYYNDTRFYVGNPIELVGFITGSLVLRLVPCSANMLSTWTDVRRLLIHEQLRSSELFRQLVKPHEDEGVLELRTSTNLNADIVLSTCQPACAFMIVNSNEYHPAATVARLEKMMNSFRNSFCIFISHDSEGLNIWEQLNLHAPIGRLRLFYVKNIRGAESVLLQIFNTFSQSEKIQNQKTYFHEEQQNLTSEQHAKSIVCDGLGRIGLSERDIQLITQGLPSLAKIIHTTAGNSGSAADALAEQLPVETSTLQALGSFFQPPH